MIVHPSSLVRDIDPGRLGWNLQRHFGSKLNIIKARLSFPEGLQQNLAIEILGHCIAINSNPRALHFYRLTRESVEKR